MSEIIEQKTRLINKLYQEAGVDISISFTRSDGDTIETEDLEILKATSTETTKITYSELLTEIEAQGG
jgi:hypothetical protein